MTIAALLLIGTALILCGIECVLAVREDRRLAELDEDARLLPRFRSSVYPPVVTREEEAFDLDTQNDFLAERREWAYRANPLCVECGVKIPNAEMASQILRINGTTDLFCGLTCRDRAIRKTAVKYGSNGRHTTEEEKENVA